MYNSDKIMVKNYYLERRDGKYFSICKKSREGKSVFICVLGESLSKKIQSVKVILIHVFSRCADFILIVMKHSICLQQDVYTMVNNIRTGTQYQPVCVKAVFATKVC